MKKVTITLALVALLLTGCKSSQASLDSLRTETAERKIYVDRKN